MPEGAAYLYQAVVADRPTEQGRLKRIGLKARPRPASYLRARHSCSAPPLILHGLRFSYRALPWDAPYEADHYSHYHDAVGESD